MATLINFVQFLAVFMITPLLLDMLNGFFPRLGLDPRRQSFVFGYMTFLTLNFSGLFVYYLWWSYFFPFYVKESKPSVFGLSLLVFVSVFLFVRAYYHLIATHVIGPGIAEKNDASYYCKVCNEYIINHDHHCVYLAQCVGWKNRRHFMLLLFFGLAGNIFAICVTWRPFFLCVWNRVENEENVLCHYMGTMSTGFVICVAFFFPWFALLVFEVLLCWTKLTTNEAFRMIRRGEFSWKMLKNACAYANFKSIFVLEAANFTEFLLFPWEAALPKQFPEKEYNARMQTR